MHLAAAIIKAADGHVSVSVDPVADSVAVSWQNVPVVLWLLTGLIHNHFLWAVG